MTMANQQVSGVSLGPINGAKAAYETPRGYENLAPSSKPAMSNGQTSNANTSSSRTPLTSVTANGKGSRDNRDRSPGINNRVESLSHKGPAMTRSGSDGDSLFDLYGNSASNSHTGLSDLDHDVPENMYRPEQDDPEGWIHRDKLARIENEELQAAGISLATARRVGRSGRHTAGKDRPGEELQTQRRSEKPVREEKRLKTSAPPPVEEENEAERDKWDLRTREEIATDATATQVYLSPYVKKSGSKIPVLMSSPMPIAQEQKERDTPLPRKRTMSNSMSPEEGTSIPKYRTRSSSIGSDALLNENAGTNGTPTPGQGMRSTSNPTSQSSPTKSRNTRSPTSTSPTQPRKVTPGIRKISGSGKLSTDLTGARPTTRSGDADRPRTAINRPEGEAPWLATMYKPDPRLPPDQQIIPTHARKQQQQQWTEDGAVPVTYDREFHPLAVNPTAANGGERPSNNKQSTPPAVSAYNIADNKDEPAWPLKPMMATPAPLAGHARPGTSGSTTGGYSTMPKLSTPPTGLAKTTTTSTSANMMQQNGGINISAAQQSRIQQTLMTDDEEAGIEKKGCGGCCVVM